jgi:protoheme IX farnesyltransferase
VAHVDVHPVVAFASLLMIAVGAGASGCLNMWWDADIDAVMTRTRKRPIPDGRIAPSEALAFGMTLAVGSVLVLALAANWLAAALLAFTIFFYVVVYSMGLKRWTAQNIVIGGAAGAFPPLIGWAAATGDVSALPALLFAVIFLWTPPHFWALSLFVRSDYAAAGVPMMPVVAGLNSTRRQILLYSLPMTAAAVAPWALGLAGWIYGALAVALSAAFLVLAIRVAANRATEPRQMGPEKRLFAFSILYLFGLFAALVADKWILA